MNKEMVMYLYCAGRMNDIVMTKTLSTFLISCFQTLLDSSFDSRHFASMLLERRSLFLMQDDMYTKYLHGIDELTSDTIDEKSVNIDRCRSNVGDTLERSVRVSLTIRHVPNVLKTKIFIGLRR